MEKFLYPNQPVRCIITGPSECGKSVFRTKLILKFFNEYEKTYTNSPSLHQDLYQKIIKCFSKNIPIHIIPNILNEEDTDVVTDEIVNDQDFQESGTKKETYESKEDLKFPQEYEDGGIIILDDLIEKEMDNPPVQALYKRSRHINLSLYIINQDYYELSKKTICTNGKIYYIFIPNIYRAVLNIYQDKSSMDMNNKEFKLPTSTCSNEKNHSLKNIYTG